MHRIENQRGWAKALQEQENSDKRYHDKYLPLMQKLNIKGFMYAYDAKLANNGRYEYLWYNGTWHYNTNEYMKVGNKVMDITNLNLVNVYEIIDIRPWILYNQQYLYMKRISSTRFYYNKKQNIFILVENTKSFIYKRLSIKSKWYGFMKDKESVELVIAIAFGILLKIFIITLFIISLK